jgi:hypothetical protein
MPPPSKDSSKERTHEHPSGESQADLLPLDEVTRRLHPSGSAYAGIRAIPIAQIVGTENRHGDFDRNFLARRPTFGTAQDPDVEIEQPPWITTGEQGREERDDPDHDERDPEEDQDDEVRDGEQLLHQPQPT